MLKFLRCFHILLYCSSSCTVLIYYKSSFFQAKRSQSFHKKSHYEDMMKKVAIDSNLIFWVLDGYKPASLDWRFIFSGWSSERWKEILNRVLRPATRHIFSTHSSCRQKEQQGDWLVITKYRNRHQQHSHHHQGAWKLKLQSKSVVNWKISRGQSHYKIYEWK